MQPAKCHGATGAGTPLTKAWKGSEIRLGGSTALPDSPNPFPTKADSSPPLCSPSSSVQSLACRSHVHLDGSQGLSVFYPPSVTGLSFRLCSYRMASSRVAIESFLLVFPSNALRSCPC